MKIIKNLLTVIVLSTLIIACEAESITDELADDTVANFETLTIDQEEVLTVNEDAQQKTEDDEDIPKGNGDNRMTEDDEDIPKGSGDGRMTEDDEDIPKGNEDGRMTEDDEDIPQKNG